MGIFPPYLGLSHPFLCLPYKANHAGHKTGKAYNNVWDIHILLLIQLSISISLRNHMNFTNILVMTISSTYWKNWNHRNNKHRNVKCYSAFWRNIYYFIRVWTREAWCELRQMSRGSFCNTLLHVVIVIVHMYACIINCSQNLIHRTGTCMHTHGYRHVCTHTQSHQTT